MEILLASQKAKINPICKIEPHKVRAFRIIRMQNIWRTQRLWTSEVDKHTVAIHLLWWNLMRAIPLPPDSKIRTKKNMTKKKGGTSWLSSLQKFNKLSKKVASPILIQTILLRNRLISSTSKNNKKKWKPQTGKWV